MDKKETVTVRQNTEKEAVLAQLRQVPIVQVACQKAGVSRATFYRFRTEDKEFASAINDAIAEGVAFINDMSESQVVSLIKDRNWPAISFWLKHHHPQYANKVEVTANVHTTPKELTPEQEAEIERAIRLASLVESTDKKDDEQHEPGTTV